MRQRVISMYSDDWRRIAAACGSYSTPMYVLWEKPISDAIAILKSSLANLGLRTSQWYSFKTLPISKVAAATRSLGSGIEVVSEFEFAAAKALGYPAERILVNGPGKQRWLTTRLRRINVIFDSILEIERLAPLARRLDWRVGVRLSVKNQYDPDDPQYPAQFGLEPDKIEEALRYLSREEVTLDILHFHMHSRVATFDAYSRSIAEWASVSRRLDLAPTVIDVGGGLPDCGVENTSGGTIRSVADAFAEAISCTRTLLPSVKELWTENGRFIVSDAGILVVSVIDVKRIRGTRFLICDGGRTNHALESDWLSHSVALQKNDENACEREFTVICGPTCMAYDYIFKGQFTSNVDVGDRLIYLNAGAYHIPWETRFSRGLCRILWTANGRDFSEIRRPESLRQWLTHWGYGEDSKL
jgi:diaminopimelate decarboxylase